MSTDARFFGEIVVTKRAQKETHIKSDPYPIRDSPEHEAMALLTRKRYGLSAETPVLFFGSVLTPAGADVRNALSTDSSVLQGKAIVVCGCMLDSTEYLCDCLCLVTDAGATDVSLHIEPSLFGTTSEAVFALYRQARPDMVKQHFLNAA